MRFNKWPEFEPFCQKILFHRQLTNLGMKAVNFIIVILAGAVATSGKNITKTVYRSTGLVGVQLVLGSNCLDC